MIVVKELTKYNSTQTLTIIKFYSTKRIGEVRNDIPRDDLSGPCKE